MPTKDILEKHNFKHQKKYGQNFLTSSKIPSRIADECIAIENGNFSEKERVMILEIGPGAGILTRELCKRYEKVVAVEIDTGLIPVLSETLSDCDNVTVVNEDIMNVELESFIAQHRIAKDGTLLPVSVCANLPYYITSPVIMKLIEEYSDFDYITVMVQKEVAMRLCSKPRDELYGAITAQINLYASVTRLFTVSAGCFNPKPKVDSAVIRIKISKDNPYRDYIKKTSKLIKAAFSMRRKTLANTLMTIKDELIYSSKEELCALFEKLYGNPNIRGEELSCSQFVELSKILMK